MWYVKKIAYFIKILNRLHECVPSTLGNAFQDHDELFPESTRLPMFWSLVKMQHSFHRLSFPLGNQIFTALDIVIRTSVIFRLYQKSFPFLLLPQQVVETNPSLFDMLLLVQQLFLSTRLLSPKTVSFQILNFRDYFKWEFRLNYKAKKVIFYV